MSRKAIVSAIEDQQSEKLAAILAPLSVKYRIFVQHYCRYLNVTAAAIAAGYPEKFAGQHGWHIRNREEVSKAISAYLKAIEITPEDNLAGIRRIADADLSQYFTLREVFEDVRKRIPLKTILAETLEQLRIEDTLFLQCEPKSLTPLQKTEMLQTIKSLELSAARLRLQIKRNPLATKIAWTTVSRFEKALDIDKLVEDKVPIKSVKYTEHGIQVELYSAPEARRDLARVHGSFEKDNAQKPLVALTAPVVNVFDKSPPLAENEIDIDDIRDEPAPVKIADDDV